MRMQFKRPARHGFSLIEVIVVIATVLLVLAVLPVILGHGRKPRHPMPCGNHLKQVALASRMWSNDHDGRFPWQVSTNQGGTLEFAPSPDVFRHFEAMSNELSSPKILVCPRDAERFRASRFGPPLANSNVSYFIGLEASETKPQSILTGDRNLIGGVTNGALLIFLSNSVPRWEASIHTNQGNIALGDGSVQQLTAQTLARQFQSAFQSQPSPVISLAIPRTPQDLPGRAPPVAGFRLPMPLIGAVLGSAALLGAGWVIRRRLLAAASEPDQSP